eukprot:15057483-Ditylum_brightwellii.AAC.1
MTALIAAAAVDLVGSPGFTLGAEGPVQAILQALNVLILMEILELAFLSSNVVFGAALGNRHEFLVDVAM